MIKQISVFCSRACRIEYAYIAKNEIYWSTAPIQNPVVNHVPKAFVRGIQWVVYIRVSARIEKAAFTYYACA